MKIGDIRIGKRLGISFGLVLVLLAAVVWLGLSSLQKINGNLKEIVDTNYAKIRLANDSAEAFYRLTDNIQAMMVSKNGPEKTKDNDAVENQRKKYSEAIDKLNRIETTDEGKKLLAGIAGSIENSRATNNRIIELSLAGRDADAISLFNGQGRPLVSKINDQMKELVKYEEKRIKARYDESEQLHSTAKSMMLIMGILAIGFGIAISLYITRSIVLPMREAVNAANHLAGGDLTAEVEAKTKDEAGQLLLAMKHMIEKLRLIVADVKIAADNVAAGSQQLSSGSEQLAQGATEQAAAAEEASSSMDEMTSTIMQNADNAQQTEKIALKSAEDARESGKSVSATVSAMNEIAEKISIIEEIARQTNLLALNAAIEAARAGEHGKGFAVVASEVRKLAERSQTAAAEISGLSKDSVQVADRAGQMLTKLVPDIQKTAELVQEISAASKEQNTGAQQINQAIQQLDQVIQQNAGASEEMASTAEELSSQAEHLQEIISFFKTGDIRKAEKAAVHKKVKVAHLAQQPRKEAAHDAHAKKALSGIALDMGNGGGNGDAEDKDFERY